MKMRFEHRRDKNDMEQHSVRREILPAAVPAVILAAVLLAGCGGTGTGAAPAASTQAAPVTAAETVQQAQSVSPSEPAASEAAASAAGEQELSPLAAMSLQDLNGETVRMEDLLAENQVTMVNLWTTWCGPCLREMPELAKLHEEFARDGGGIVGICLDAGSEQVNADARQILTDTGVGYPVLAASDALNQLLPVQAVPTSIFVDAKGYLLADPVVGADFAGYRAAMEQARKTLQEAGK